MYFSKKICRIYAACGVSQTPIIYALDGGLRYHNYEIPDYESIKKVFGEKSARLFVKNKGYHAYWGYTSSDDSPITQFFTTDSFEIEDKDFYLNGRACVW